MIFDINYTTQVLIGEGAAKQVGQKVKERGVLKALCVFDQGIKSIGVVDQIEKSLSAEEIEVFEFGDVSPNPPDTVVNAAAEVGRKNGVDAIIGIGGGSSLDTAKATNVLMGNPGEIKQYFGFNIPQKEGKLLVLIPTTSGTGSEVSQIAAISDSGTGIKSAVVGSNSTADLAIVDPLLTKDCPPRITAYSGMDTIAHAIEAYTSALATPISDIMALESLKIAVKALPIAFKEGSNIQARQDMCFACTLSGMAFLQSPPHIGHSVGTPLGNTYHIAHGLGIAAVLPGVVEYIWDIMPEKLRKIGAAFGLDLDAGLSDKEIGSTIASAIRDMNKQLELPTLKELKIPEDDLPKIAEEAFAEPTTRFLPKKTTVEDTLGILRKEYSF